MDRYGDTDDTGREPPADAAQVPPPPPPAPQRPWHELSVEEQLEHYRRTAQTPPPQTDSVAQYYEYYDYSVTGRPFKGYSGQPRWWAIIAVLTVLVLGGCSFLLYMAYQGVSSSGLGPVNVVAPQIPPAAVHVGAPMSWRELDRWTPGGAGNVTYAMTFGQGVACADFDSDGDDEILSSREPTAYVTGTLGIDTLYELDGSQRPLTLTGHMYTDPLIPWDYDGDGTPEVACARAGQDTPVFSLGGQEVTRLPGITTAQPLTGDIDGDGKHELLLVDPVSFAARNAYGPGGRLVWSASQLRAGWSQATGDVDGDGLDELLDTSGGTLSVMGLGQPAQTIGGWPSYYGVSCCADLNGDGTDELIALNEGYLDPAAGSFVSFQYPGHQTPYGGGMLGEGQVVVSDADGDGAYEIITISSATPGTPLGPTAMLNYDLGGNLTYHEEFGEGVAGAAVAQAQGQEYLVVMTATRLLVHP